MKRTRQRGQASTEYLIGLAGVVILAISGVKVLLQAIHTQWDTLCFWLTLPNP
jgi:hypothetical protein